MREHQGDAALGKKPLRDIEFVVFDCEMTGLQPLQGDEIIQIGAVQVVQNRILTGEGLGASSTRPPYSPGSIKFYGITDVDVVGKPSIVDVLPEFRAYVGSGVMMGHNAAFDMKFISLRRARRAYASTIGARHHARLLHARRRGGGPLPGRALRSVRRLDHGATHGVMRHHGHGRTAPELIGRLEVRGLLTFGEVMAASNMAAELRHRAALIAHGGGAGG
jgi:DNA polymerase-3 subunit epsilon